MEDVLVYVLDHKYSVGFFLTVTLSIQSLPIMSTCVKIYMKSEWVSLMATFMRRQLFLGIYNFFKAGLQNSFQRIGLWVY